LPFEISLKNGIYLGVSNQGAGIRIDVPKTLIIGRFYFVLSGDNLNVLTPVS